MHPQDDTPLSGCKSESMSNNDYAGFVRVDGTGGSVDKCYHKSAINHPLGDWSVADTYVKNVLGNNEVLPYHTSGVGSTTHQIYTFYTKITA